KDSSVIDLLLSSSNCPSASRTVDSVPASHSKNLQPDSLIRVTIVPIDIAHEEVGGRSRGERKINFYFLQTCRKTNCHYYTAQILRITRSHCCVETPRSQDDEIGQRCISGHKEESVFGSHSQSIKGRAETTSLGLNFPIRNAYSS